MNRIVRWLKFNAVGIVGAAVQLISLAALQRCLHGHALLATATAVEVTLLHNFIAHCRFTWKEREVHATWRSTLLRFHLSNGGVSLAGNLLAVQLLSIRAHMPVEIANGVGILACSVVNFLLGDRWVFRAEPPSSPHGSGSPAFS